MLEKNDSTVAETAGAVPTATDPGLFTHDVCVVGGCGHVGLPLAITMADHALRVAIYDINDQSVETVRSGRMPFLERGAESVLERVLEKNLLSVTTDPNVVRQARAVVVVIGTPVDEHMNPTFHTMRRFFRSLLPYLVDGQCIILRSTVYPGTTEKIRDLLVRSGKNVHVAFCPERVAEGKAMEELIALPQIISGCDKKAIEMASEVFGKIAVSLIHSSPLEAELTKLFANVWRYIQFATANQFFMIASDYGLDFYRIYDALTRDYPRMQGLPKAGFAAGPCLFKDTMQLATANHNTFSLGHAAMLINEGLPNYIVEALKKKYELEELTVGILGMAFKGDSDDPRESLSFKLRKLLEYESRAVVCTDVHIADPSFLSLEDVLEKADLLLLATPHREYRDLQTTTPMVDIWNFYGKGSLI